MIFSKSYVTHGPWAMCGDFNMIYEACDKNNGRLHTGVMRSFRSLLDDLHLDELHLSGRLYTWSNRRDSPTLERLDRVLASIDWLELYPSHHLRCLSSDTSDHAPLLLVLNTEPWAQPRFRFEDFWTRMDGFKEVVQAAWNAYHRASDPCKTLDRKLRAVARALRSWRDTSIGSIRLRLAAARAIILEFDTAQESRPLSVQERDLRRELQDSTPYSGSPPSAEPWLDSAPGTGSWPRETHARDFSTYRPATGVEKIISSPSSMTDRRSQRRTSRQTLLSTTTTGCWAPLLLAHT